MLYYIPQTEHYGQVVSSYAVCSDLCPETDCPDQSCSCFSLVAPGSCQDSTLH
jgi:hypothetical protein